MATQTALALDLLHSEVKEERAKGAHYLGTLGAEGVKASIPLLSDSDWHLRYRACEIIGFTKETSGVEYLLLMLQDKKDHVRYMAVKSLSFCGGKEQAPLIEPMLNDENPFVVRITKKVLDEWK